MTMNRIMLNLLLRKPFYGYILSSLNVTGSKSIETIKLIVGPTVQLLYNPEWLEALTENEAYGAVLHELLHLIFMHSLRRAGRERKIWAMAGDMAVNEHISPDMLPEDALTVQKANRIFGTTMEPYKSADYYYERLIEAAPPSSFPFSLRKDTIILRFPNEYDISIALGDEGEQSELNKKAVESKLEEITRQASTEGEIPGKLAGLMSGIYRSVHVNWRNILKQFMTGKGRMHVHKTVKRLSKRFDDMPGNKRHKGIEALVAIDESASIHDDDVMAFYQELRALKRSVKANFMVTRFDTDCTRPVPLEKYLKTTDRAKHGGTDFRPIFHLAETMHARMMLIFTDGEGTMPDSVKQNVLWILTKKTEIPPALGTSVFYSGG